MIAFGRYFLSVIDFAINAFCHASMLRTDEMNFVVDESMQSKLVVQKFGSPTEAFACLKLEANDWCINSSPMNHSCSRALSVPTIRSFLTFYLYTAFDLHLLKHLTCLTVYPNLINSLALPIL